MLTIMCSIMFLVLLSNYIHELILLKDTKIKEKLPLILKAILVVVMLIGSIALIINNLDSSINIIWITLLFAVGILFFRKDLLDSLR